MWCMDSVTAVGITCQQPWKTSGRTGMWLPSTSAHLKYIRVFEHICEPWRTTLRAKRSLTTMPQLSLIIHNWQQLLLRSLPLPKPSLKNCFKLTGVSRGVEGAVRSSDFFSSLHPYLFRQIKSGKDAASAMLNIWLLSELDFIFVSNVQVGQTCCILARKLKVFVWHNKHTHTSVCDCGCRCVCLSMNHTTYMEMQRVMTSAWMHFLPYLKKDKENKEL